MGILILRYLDRQQQQNHHQNKKLIKEQQKNLPKQKMDILDKFETKLSYEKFYYRQYQLGRLFHHSTATALASHRSLHSKKWNNKISKYKNSNSHKRRDHKGKYFIHNSLQFSTTFHNMKIANNILFIIVQNPVQLKKKKLNPILI